MKKVLRLIIYVTILCLVLSYFKYGPQSQIIDTSQRHPWENYDSSLLYRLRTTDDLISYADDSLGQQNRQTLSYVRFLTQTISLRFFHGYSSYSFQHNWLSYLAGRFVWSDLDAVVIPNDIMKFPNAACSQVSIVLADALKKIGVSYRKVGLKGHFALEAEINGKWYFFDPNLEPHFAKGEKSLEELISSKELYQGYNGHLPLKRIQEVFSTISYGQPNAVLAPHATLFHRVTFLASILVPFVIVIYTLVDLMKLILHRKNARTSARKSKSIGLNA